MEAALSWGGLSLDEINVYKLERGMLINAGCPRHIGSEGGQRARLPKPR
jgi:hypothetical protein